MAPVNTYPMSYKHFGPDDRLISQGQGSVGLEQDNFVITTSQEAPYLVYYREVAHFLRQGYLVLIDLPDGRFLLSQMGDKTVPFCREFSQKRNLALMKDLLMDELGEVDYFEASYQQMDTKGAVVAGGRCLLKLFDRAVVLLPDDDANPLLRVFYSRITGVDEKNFQVIVSQADGQRLVLGEMGEFRVTLARRLTEQRDLLFLGTMRMLREVFPGLPSAALRQLALLMGDGYAVKKGAVDAIDRTIWPVLESRVAQAQGRSETYEYLRRKSVPDLLYIGLRREFAAQPADVAGTETRQSQTEERGEGSPDLGALATLGGLIDQGSGEAPQEKPEEKPQEKPKEEIWFMVPLPSNAIAMEVVTAPGHATYFFKIKSRGEFHSVSLAALQDDIAQVMDDLSLSLIDLRFRRTPIYIGEEMFDRPEYVVYKFAVKKLPNLRRIRELFIGRVIHRSLDQWKKDTESLLEWNTSIKDDSQKWRAGNLEDEDAMNQDQE